MPELDISLPYRFSCRSYQAEFWNAMKAGCKRAALVWHRRAGKDLTTLNWTIREMLLGRPGTYYYFFPTFNQGRKILWDGMDKVGIPFLDRFPAELVENKNEVEMQVTLRRGDGKRSVFQIIGTDRLDGIVGPNPIGCVFSEYSLQNPKGWNLVRPILAENDGWAVFIYTPRGKNWGHKLWKGALEDPQTWFASLKTVDDTTRDAPGEADYGQRVITLDAIDVERRSGMPEELIQQEFWCSFEGAIVGAYYADQVVRMREEKRIRVVKYDPMYLVDTAWDLGSDDETAIGFTQTRGDFVHWIDYHASRRAPDGIATYVKLLRQKPFAYGDHFGPHDIKVTEWSTGNTRLQHAGSLGLNFTVVPKLSLSDGIQAARRLLAKSVMDEETCAPLIEALMTYRREFDEQTQTFAERPVHDWSSHPADMVRYRGIAYQDDLLGKRSGDFADTLWPMFGKRVPDKADAEWNPYHA